MRPPLSMRLVTIFIFEFEWYELLLIFKSKQIFIIFLSYMFIELIALLIWFITRLQF